MLLVDPLLLLSLPQNPPNQKQGPQYPGSMKSWYDQQFFSESTMVAPSFMGEIPRKDQFKSVKDTFKQPLAEVYLNSSSHTPSCPEHSLSLLSRLQISNNNNNAFVSILQQRNHLSAFIAS
jgi:hypothetical protein